MRFVLRIILYLLVFPVTYYAINTVINVSKKNEVELTYVYSTEKTLNNKNLFIDDYMAGKVLSQFEPIHYNAEQIHEILTQVGLIKQDLVYDDPTFKCLSDIDVRKIEMHNISPIHLSLKYTFKSKENEKETIDKIIKCNNENLIPHIGKFIVPRDIEIHKKRLENLVEYLPSIAIGSQDQINTEYLIQPTTELVEEIENLQWLENLFKDIEDHEFKKQIRERITEYKLQIIIDLKKIERNKKLKLYERANSFDEWVKENQIKRTKLVISMMNNSDLNIYEISKNFYRTKSIEIKNTYSIYIFTLLIGALIIVLIENLQRSFYKRNRKI